MKKLFSIVFIFLFLLLFVSRICAAAQTQAKVFNLNYASADALAEIVKKLIGPDGKISSDPRANILIVVDYPENLAKIEQIVKQLDTRIEQVAIEAAVIETSTQTLKDLGFRWGRSGSVVFYKGSSGIPSKDFQVVFNALDSNSQTNISSHSRVLTQERRPAKIEVSSQTVTGKAESVIYDAKTGQAIVIPERAKTGSFLLVTASTHPDGTITLDVQPSLVTPERSENYPRGYIDPLARMVATTVNIKDGETVAIGEADFLQETDSSDIAAQATAAKSRKTLIFISAKIIK